MTKTKKSKKRVVAYDLFERKYAEEIDVMVDSILAKEKKLIEENYEDLYDQAHEEAMYVLAHEKNVELE
jgi:hypothetical protein